MKANASAIEKLKALASSAKLAATVSVTQLKTTVSDITSRAVGTVSYVSLNATVSARTLIANTATTVIKATVLFGETAKEEFVRAIDVLSNRLTKRKDDAVTVADSSSRRLAKRLSENLAATDDINGAAADDDNVIRFTKVVAELVGIADEVAVAAHYRRGFSSDAATSDVYSRQIVKRLTDLVAVTDTTERRNVSGPKPSDLASVADALVMASVKRLLDAATVADIPAWSLNKPRSELIAITDQSVRSVGKAPTESLSTTETGYMRWQSYADQSYFAEAYVGSEQTF